MLDEKSSLNKGILVLNAGSSSIKFSLFLTPSLKLIYSGQVKEIYNHPILQASDSNKKSVVKKDLSVKNHSEALNEILSWIDVKTQHLVLAGVGHRVVHGGNEFSQPIIITHDIILKLEKLIPLAPLHQSHNLQAIKALMQLDSKIPQIACFDTAFHQTQLELSKMVALPQALREEGIQRYGFHGLSYEYIASVLEEKIGALGNQKIIVAHLGNGASVCAMEQRRSVATSMGFTALEGLIMGTRTGSLDPGILLYLLEEKHFTVSSLTKLLYEQSGLLGVSGLSSDMQILIEDGGAMANTAINLFCYRAAKEIGALTVSLKGCDAIIFTAGIGENCPLVRAKVVQWLEWMGTQIDESKNNENNLEISVESCKVKIFVVPTNEELMIANQTYRLTR